MLLYATATNALPGWSVFYGNTEQTQINYIHPKSGLTLVTTNQWVIDGDFSVVLEGGGISLTQTGLVPAGTESLFFDMSAEPDQIVDGGMLEVLMGGEALTYFAVSSAPDYTLYGANISAFAGQSATLAFLTKNLGGGIPQWTTDDIEFSPEVVPEPGEFTLIAFGAILFGLRRWQRSALTGF
jgi:hypothetical protein